MNSEMRQRPAAPDTEEWVAREDGALVTDELVVDEISIDGMCGVY